MSRDALVVGINSYQGLPGLQAPAHDAEAIAHLLHTQGEFRVQRLPEVIHDGRPQVGQSARVTLRALEAALVKLFKPQGSNVPHTALFYFSGHGIQKEAGIREGYLALSDSQLDVGFYGLSLFWLRRLLQESPVRQRIIWLDCCHSGEFLNFLEADPGARPGTDRLFMAASREYESAYESLNSDYSVFTQALMTGLDSRRAETGIVTNHSLTAWVNQRLKGELQQPLFENSGSEIILTRSHDGPAPAQALLATDICPYRGLEVFDEAHAPYFFGREELTDQLLDKLRTSRFVSVVGASGSGKSSLVRAGLMRTLRQGQKFSGSGGWQMQLITPIEHPLKSLAAAFVDLDSTGLERAEQLRRAETFLREGGNGLAQLVRARLLTGNGPSSGSQANSPHLLLVIDQFEEVFTLCQGPLAEQERHQFLASLIDGIASAGTLLSVVIVLRADFLGKCSLYGDLTQKIEQNLVMVTPLTYQQIKDTIVRPAQKVGLVCEPNLVHTMLLDVVGAPGELPLLQYTLLELWQRRRRSPQGDSPPCLTLDAYNDLGGVRGTLQKRATEIFYSLSADEQRIAKRIFLGLTQLGEGTEDTRRRILKSELVSPQFPVEVVERVLEKLVAVKLVVTNRVRPAQSPQEHIKQELTNVSTAVRVAQMMAQKAPPLSSLLGRALPPQPLPQTALPTLIQPPAVVHQEIQPLPTSPRSGWVAYEETVDVVHEALIRNWPLLRTWLDENREMLRRQRRIELAAQEWEHVGLPKGTGYLLRGSRLIDAEDFLGSYPEELSALAGNYISTSQNESHRVREESRLLQIAVPSVLLIALGMTFNQYRSALQIQAEKDYQLQIATSREQAAIAQSILQEPSSDPTAALLISRLSVERGGPTDEAQSSLRAALQNLRLQMQLPGHSGPVRQTLFSADQRYLATASVDGTIRLWSMQPQTIYATSLQALQVLMWQANGRVSAVDGSADITAMAFSPDGDKIAAIASGASHINVWATASGQVRHQINLPGPARQVAFSPDGTWVATVTDEQGSADSGNTGQGNSRQSIDLWAMETGELQAHWATAETVQMLQFSPDGQRLLAVGAEGNVRLWPIAAVGTAMPAAPPAALLSHPDRVRDASFSTSGRWVVTASDDGQARLWDVATGQLRQVFPHAALVAPHSPSQEAEAGSLPLRVGVATAEMATMATRLPALTRVQISPDEQWVATTGTGLSVGLWSAESAQLTHVLSATSDSQMWAASQSTPMLAFSPDSQLILAGDAGDMGADGGHKLTLWQTQTGARQGTLQGPGGSVTATTFSPDGAYIATASVDGMVRLWAATAGGELPTVQVADEPVRWVQFMPSSPPAAPAAAAPDPAADGQSLWAEGFTAPAAALPSAAALTSPPEPDANPGHLTQLMAVTADGTLKRWGILAPAYSSVGHVNHPDHAAAETAAARDEGMFSHRVATLERSAVWAWLQNLVAAFDRGQGHPVRPLGHPTVMTSSFPRGQTDELSSLLGDADPQGTAAPTLTAVAFSLDSQYVATATTTGWLTLYRRAPGQSSQMLHRLQIGALTASSAAATTASMTNLVASSGVTQLGVTITDLALSADNRHLLGVGDDLKVRLWDVQSGQQIHLLEGHASTISQAAFSPDGQQVITAGRDGTARLWDVRSGQVLQVFSFDHQVLGVSFSPDGTQVAIADGHGTVHIINASTGAPQVILTGHLDAVLDVQFSPDGQSLVTASQDGTARLWNAYTGLEQAQLRPTPTGEEAEAIEQAFFSPDGQYIATRTATGQIQLWAATWDVLLHLARDRSLRQLTPEECIRYLRLSPQTCPTLDLADSTSAAGRI